MRMFAIGDIHGCSGFLEDLLDWVAPTATDHLVFLGDYVDRGPDTRGVVDRLISLQQQIPLSCLRGNHELMMLAAHSGRRGDYNLWLAVGGAQTLDSYALFPGRSGALDLIPDHHWEFLQTQLLPFFETEHHIFVHATVDPNLPLHEQSDDALYWQKLPTEMRHISGKKVICGHTTQKDGLPRVVPGAICIDTYAYGGGRLTCLDVNSGSFWQVDGRGNRYQGQIPMSDG